MSQSINSTSGAPIVAASYERVSTRNQGQHGFSLGAQHASLEDFAAAQGWTLPEHLRFRDGEEEAASGTSWDLPGLNQMLEAARRGEFTVLAVPDLDRFARSLVKGLVLEEQLRKHGVKVAYQRVPVEDSPEGRLLKHQLFSFAEFEREKTTLRTASGKRSKAQSGQVVGAGTPPFGYRFTRSGLSNGRERTSGLELDPATAPIARETLLSLRTHSTVDASTDLNRRGVPAPRGGAWTAKAVRGMARNPVYCGTWVYGRLGQTVTPEEPIGIPVSVEPLISRQEWGDIQRALDHRRFARRGQRLAGQDPWLARGLLTCGHCHGAVRTLTNNQIRYYACGRHLPSDARLRGKPVCDLPAVHAADMEAELTRIIGETLLDPHNLAAGLAAGVSQHRESGRMRAERLEALDSEIAKQRKRLDSLVDGLADTGAGEARQAVLRRLKDVEDLIDRFAHERAELAAVRTDGLSREEATAIEAFAAEMRRGLDQAAPSDLRELFQAIGVRGTIHADPNGVTLGRKHAFRIEWTARIELPNSDTRIRVKGKKKSAPPRAA